MRIVIIYAFCIIANSAIGNAQTIINSTQHVGKHTFTSIDQVFVSEVESNSSSIISQNIIRSYKLDVEVLNIDSISIGNNLNASLYPNPTEDGLLTLEFKKSLSEDITIRLYSLNGSLIEETVFDTKQNLRIINLNYQDLATGLYFLNVQNRDRTSTFKFAKQ